MLPTAKTAIIKEITDESVVLLIGDVELEWPKGHLDAKVGDEIHLVALTNADLSKERDEIAKTLLTQLLNNEA